MTVARYNQPSYVLMKVMSPHQQMSIAALLTVKSRPIRSGRAAALGPESW